MEYGHEAARRANPRVPVLGQARPWKGPLETRLIAARRSDPARRMAAAALAAVANPLRMSDVYHARLAAAWARSELESFHDREAPRAVETLAVPSELLVQHGVYRAAFDRAGRQTPSREWSRRPSTDPTCSTGRQVGVRSVGRQVPAQDRQAHHAIRS